MFAAKCFDIPDRPIRSRISAHPVEALAYSKRIPSGENLCASFSFSPLLNVANCELILSHIQPSAAVPERERRAGQQHFEVADVLPGAIHGQARERSLMAAVVFEQHAGPRRHRA